MTFKMPDFSKSPFLFHQTKRDKVTAKREVSPSQSPSQLQDDSYNITNKYVEVALLADQQIVAVHGNNTEEFLLLTGSIVSVKMYIT